MPSSRTGSCRAVAAVRSSMARSFLTGRTLRKRHPELALAHRLLRRGLDSADARAGRAAAAPVDHRLHALGRPLEDGLDGTVRPVPDPAAEVERGRAGAGRLTEADSLHAAAHEHAHPDDVSARRSPPRRGAGRTGTAPSAAPRAPRASARSPGGTAPSAGP